MERFKACEKEMKTKAYSKEGLASNKMDPKEKVFFCADVRVLPMLMQPPVPFRRKWRHASGSSTFSTHSEHKSTLTRPNLSSCRYGVRSVAKEKKLTCFVCRQRRRQTQSASGSRRLKTSSSDTSSTRFVWSLSFAWSTTILSISTSSTPSRTTSPTTPRATR